jgi:hypothetical protein
VATRDICAALDAAGITPEWTANDVVTAMYATVTEKRWTAPAELGNPIGYLRFLLGSVTPEYRRALVERKRKAAAKAQAGRDSALAAARRATRPAPRRTSSTGGAILAKAVLRGDASINTHTGEVTWFASPRE